MPGALGRRKAFGGFDSHASPPTVAWASPPDEPPVTSFVCIDAATGTIETLGVQPLAERLAQDDAPGGNVLGVCGHAGFRVPDHRGLLPILEGLRAARGGRLVLASALADARHSSDDRGSSPVRVHVERVGDDGRPEVRKERLRFESRGDAFASAIPFRGPKDREPGAVSQRTILDAYRRLVADDAYRWVSGRVMAAAERALAGAPASLLDLHRHLRDVVLEEQLGGVPGVALLPTVATAYPDGFHEHIVKTHRGQAAVAVDLLRGPDHAREILGFFRAARTRTPESVLPRWLFASVDARGYFCGGFAPARGTRATAPRLSARS